MAKDKLISFFDKEQTPDFDGLIEYKNPRLFTGNVPSYATHYCTDDESIASVYEGKGVERYEVQSNKKSAAQAADSSAASTESQRDSFDEAGHQRSASVGSSPAERSEDHVNGVQQEERQEQQKEEVSWRDMTWPQMRAKAASLTDRPITSKAVAIEVLEEHLG